MFLYPSLEEAALTQDVYRWVQGMLPEHMT